jgi:hypothetical protein
MRRPSKESLSKQINPVSHQVNPVSHQVNPANHQVNPVKLFPAKPQPSYQQPVSQQVNRIADDEYLFPDLPPPPDALLDQSPPPEQAFFQIAANGHTSSSFQNSR